MVWWTCSREEMTLPSWTSSTMVRTWRVVTAAGDRNSEVGRGQETLVQSPAPEHGGSPPPRCLCLFRPFNIISTHRFLLPLALPSIPSLC